MILNINNTSMDFFRTRCKEHNLKVTPQRTVIYKELSKSKDHPHASVMFKKVKRIFPDVSFDTVNRTLLTFAQIGLVQVVEGFGDPKRYDPDIGMHHHFWCIKCSNIIDIYDRSLDDINLPKNLKKQFTVLRKRVVFEGLCDKCRKKV